MNNIVYYALFDTAVNKWLIQNDLIDIKLGKNIGLIVQSGCNYFSSFQYPEEIDAGIRVTKIGTSSVRYEVGLFHEKDETFSISVSESKSLEYIFINSYYTTHLCWSQMAVLLNIRIISL